MKRPENIKRIRLFRKIRLFLFFFLFSFLAWFFISISSNSESFTKFKISIQNQNKSEISSQTEKIKIRTKIYFFLYYNIFPKKLVLESSDVLCKDEKCYILLNKNSLQKLQKQCHNATFIQFEKDTLFLHFKNKFHKKVKVVSNINIIPKKGYLLDNPIKIKPDSVLIFGDLDVLHKIKSIPTRTLNFENVTGIFEHKVALVPNKQIVDKVFLNTENVNIYGVFSKYTELELELPIQLFNESEIVNVELIPANAVVHLLVKLDNVDKINFEKIKLLAFYDPSSNIKQKAVLRLVDETDLVYSYRVVPAYADFIIKK